MIEILLNLIPGVREDETEDQVIGKRTLQIAIAVVAFGVLVAALVLMG